MKLLVSGGGTGGHVYPALSVIETIGSGLAGIGLPFTQGEAGSHAPQREGLDLLWVGSRDGIEDKMVRSAGIEFIGLAGGGVRGMGAWKAIRNGTQLVSSTWAARRIVRRFRPDVVLITGGYACVPVTLVARAERIPVLVYLPDIVPGLAIRLLSRFSALVAVTSEESIPYLPGRRVVVTGYPVRSEIGTMDRAQARRLFALDPAIPTLLVFGGSRGARSINQALVKGLPELLPRCQVIHVSGELDAMRVREMVGSLSDEQRRRYQHHTYLAEMPAALVAADLVVSRAGAATMGEFPAAGLPALLVPYPYSGQHQEHNAHYMARHGAAQVLADSDLGERLVPTVKALLDDPRALGAMRSAALALARPGAAAAIARQAFLLAQPDARKGLQVPR